MNKIISTLLACGLLLISAAAGAGATLQAFNPDSLARITGSQKGQPFVLVLWSLDCEFCQASLETLASKKRLHQDLRVITLSTDSLADPQAAALIEKRLAALGLHSNAWAFGAAPPEQLRYAIDQKWHGEMPRSYWFDASGNSKARSGVISAEMVERFLASR